MTQSINGLYGNVHMKCVIMDKGVATEVISIIKSFSFAI